MSDLPHLPLFVDAYLADTQHLSDADHGRYLKLLMLLWRTPGCHIPNDDAWIGRMLCKTPEQMQTEIRPIIKEFCRTDGNWLWQKRLLEVWQYAQRAKMQKSVSAKAAWRNKKDPSKSMYLNYKESKKERSIQGSKIEASGELVRLITKREK